MHLDWWQAFGIVCGAILAAAAVITKVVAPVLRAIRRGLSKIDRIDLVVSGDANARDALGRPAPVPSLLEWMAARDARLSAVEKWQSEHQVLHVGPDANRVAPRVTPLPGGRA